jgi:hypothetical protein
MTTTRRLAAGGLLAAGALLLMAASIALASDESPSPGVVPGGKPEATPTPAVEPATAPLAPLAAATPTPAAKPAAKPAATPTPAAKPAATPKPAKVPDADEGPIQTLTGTLGTRTDADGDVEYVLNGVELSVGPPWYWGTNNPLEKYYANKTPVTVTGRMETDPPSTKANGKANNADGPEFEVYTVNGSKVRAEGKPPWAGGPKAVGERHPGYAGWSNGKADKADKAKAAPQP